LEGVGEGSSSKTVAAVAGSPGTPTTPGSARKENVWRSVFHPGSNIATRGMGTNLFDKPSHPNSPTVYDWYVLSFCYYYVIGRCRSDLRWFDRCCDPAGYTATTLGASTVEPRG